jgi:MFS family permease
MDFSQAEAEYGKLKAQLESGALTEQEFGAQLEGLMIEDDQGQWWTIGAETGQWYWHDGEQWVARDPPRPEPVPLPTPEATPTRMGEGWAILLMAVGWAIGGFIGGLFAGFLGSLIGYAIGGVSTGLVLRRTQAFIQWKQVLIVVIGWAIGAVVGGPFLGPTYDSPYLYAIGYAIGGAIAGAIGGVSTGLALRRTQASIQWKQILVMAIGWIIGGIIGGLLAGQFGGGGYYLWAIGWTIHGAIGGWTTSWQIGKARRRST